MTIGEDIAGRSREIFKTDWKVRKGQVVPQAKDVALGNDAVEFDQVTVLYADLDGSTNLVEAKKWEFAAEVYKAFLYAATRLITSEGGSITSYDGDRVMGIFLGPTSSIAAVRCSLKINYAIKNLVQTKIAPSWKTDFVIKHVVGIDRSPARAVRTGARDNNDLVWVGNAANHAAKLTARSSAYSTWITKDVFDNLDKSTWYGSDEKVMWTKHETPAVRGHPVYTSNHTWRVA